MCKVVNLKFAKYDIYIGRPTNLSNSTKHFGNPFTHMSGTKASVEVHTRQQAVRAYELWLKGEAWKDIEPERRKWILDNLHTLKGKTLGCFCKPYDCHGDILVKLVNGELCKNE